MDSGCPSVCLEANCNLQCSQSQSCPYWSEGERRERKRLALRIPGRGNGRIWGNLQVL